MEKIESHYLVLHFRLDYVTRLKSLISFDDLNIFARIESEIFSLNDAWPSSIAHSIKRTLFPTLLFSRKEDIG